MHLKENMERYKIFNIFNKFAKKKTSIKGLFCSFTQ